jgi:hypothetical protein
MALCRYAFVATTEQDCTLQEHALRTAGCEVSCRDGRTELARLLEGPPARRDARGSPSRPPRAPYDRPPG